jgi:hypothetical protein
VAQAGSDEDVLTSAPAGMPQVHDDPARLTGARHENSVLFSLNALTSKGGHGDRPPPVAGSEQSGLIDIRQLSAQMGRMDDKKKSRVDDIMNLAGGGAFSPSLASPVLAPPPIEEYSRAAGLAPASSKNKGLIILALGVGAFVIVGAVGGAMMLTRGKGAERDDDKAAGSANATELASPSASIAMNAPSAASGATGSPNDNPSAGPAAQPSDSAPAATPPVGQTKGPSSPAKEAKLPTTSTPAKDTSLAHALAAPAVPPPAAPAPAATADQPFNMGEAKAKLGAIASSVQACKKGDGPTGSGRVVVTFAPSGAAQSAVVSGPPFEGTPTGACVSGRFRGAHVPSFTGSPFSVSKSFSIN